MKRRTAKPPTFSAWGPPLYYAEWIEAAKNYKDQDLVWREHERHARINYSAKNDPPEWRDLGGEA